VNYARCFTHKQKENLERQKDRLRKYAEGKDYKFILIDEIASGINEKRKGLHNKMGLDLSIKKGKTVSSPVKMK
jgi:predicted site-specific integrase-resolvase